MKILVTGSAGFIGFHLTRRLLQDGHTVVGLDNVNDYYDPGLKYARLAACGVEGDTPFIYGREYASQVWDEYRFYRINLEDKDRVMLVFKEESFDAVVHLAAQAGVRYSSDHPWAYN